MEIEPNLSNELKVSSSTNYSNNTQFSIESSNLNISNNSNLLFYPEKNTTNNQTKNLHHIAIISSRHETNNVHNAYNCLFSQEKCEKKLFDYNFNSSEESLLFAGDYLNEIYTNLLIDEKELVLKPKLGYMNIQDDINEQMRAILIDWLIEVHYRFRLRSETLFQTVWIIDTYLSLKQITRAKLQLLGIASLLISCKSQEIYYPPLKEFIDITDGAYVKNELLLMENYVLKVLNFNIVSPTSNDFFNIIAKAFNFDKKQFYLGKYFLESALIDYQMIRFSPSVLAVSCAYIVMKFFGISNYKTLYSSDVVKENCPQKIIKEAAREICFLVKNLSQSTLKAVKDKYSLSQFLNVAQYCEQK
jgi:cyclin B